MSARAGRAATHGSAALALLLALAACNAFAITDPYGNRYGDWYNHGADYRWQMATCEAAIDTDKVPNADRKHFMRCCMWRHGVPIDDANSCSARVG
ncbi:MAG: hypothetical protein ACREFQ_00615 [Stellaceae bacterium]